MLEALERSDFETIRVLGHGVKGFGKSHGFAYSSEVGSELEQAAGERSVEAIEAVKEGVNGMQASLDRVDVTYE